MTSNREKAIDYALVSVAAIAMETLEMSQGNSIAQVVANDFVDVLTKTLLLINEKAQQLKASDIILILASTVNTLHERLQLAEMLEMIEQPNNFRTIFLTEIDGARELIKAMQS